MNFAFTEEQEELRRGARRFLEAHAGPGKDAGAWPRIVSELGWPALIVPEAYGGAGMGHVELVAVMEEMGRALLGSPFFATVCLGETALLAAGNQAQQQTWLPRLAEGELTATAALTLQAEARPDEGENANGGFVLSGVLTSVVDGHTADLLIVAARGRDGDEPMIFALPADTKGISRAALPTLDRTRPLADVRLIDVRVPAAARLGGASGGAAGSTAAALARTLDLAAVALAAEQLGGAQRCLELAVDYAKTRVQFGRAIGSFQAIKHKCADLFVAVESARSAVYWAGWAAATSSSELPLAAATAKAWASDAFYRCAAENLQIHGGIGFTWEHPAHLYLRRARAAQTMLGDVHHHREQVAKHILGEVV